MLEYVPIAIMLAAGIVLPVIAFVAARVLAPRRAELMKYEAYECGVESLRPVRERMSVRYYVIAVLFVVFDVETIFMFPWAVRYRALGLFGLIEMALFIGVLLLGYFYIWRKGALAWV